MALQYSDLFKRVTDLSTLAHAKLREAFEILEGLDPNSVANRPLVVEIKNRVALLESLLSDIKEEYVIRRSMFILPELMTEGASENQTAFSNMRYTVTNAINNVFLPLAPQEGDVVGFVLELGTSESTIRIRGEQLDETITLSADRSQGCHFTYSGTKWLFVPSNFDIKERPETGKNAKGRYRKTGSKIEQMLEVRLGETGDWPMPWPDDYQIVSSIVSRQPRNTANERGFVIYPDKTRIYLPDIVGGDNEPTGNVNGSCTFLHDNKLAFVATATDTVLNVNTDAGLVPATEIGLNLYKVDSDGTLDKLTLAGYSGKGLSFSSDVSYNGNNLFLMESGYDPLNPGSKTPSFLKFFTLQLETSEGGPIGSGTVHSISTATSYGDRLETVRYNGGEAGTLIAITANPSKYSQAISVNDQCQIFKLVDGNLIANEVIKVNNSENYSYTDVTTFTRGDFVYFVFSNDTDQMLKVERFTISTASHSGSYLLQMDGSKTGGIKKLEMVPLHDEYYLIGLGDTGYENSSIIRFTFDISGVPSIGPVTINTQADIAVEDVDGIHYFFQGETPYLTYVSKERGVKIGKITGTGDSLNIFFGEEYYYPYASDVKSFVHNGTRMLFIDYDASTIIGGVTDYREGKSDLAIFQDKLGKLDALVTGIRYDTTGVVPR